MFAEKYLKRRYNEGYRAGLRDAYLEGYRQGYKETQERWEAWNNRRLEAAAQGKEFH